MGAQLQTPRQIAALSKFDVTACVSALSRQSYYFGPVREEQVQTIDNNKTTKITDTAGNCLDRHKGTLKIQVIGSDIANTVQRNLTSLRPIGREDSKLIMRLSAIESGDTSGSMSV